MDSQICFKSGGNYPVQQGNRWASFKIIMSPEIEIWQTSGISILDA